MKGMSLALVALATTGACSYAHIGSGEVGVVRTPDGIQQKIYTPGDWHIGVFDHTMTYSVRSQEKEERLDVQSVDGLGITLETSVRFHIMPQEVIALDQELGPDYYAVLIGPTLRSQARRVIGRFKPEEIYSSQREVIEREIREGVETAIKGRHVQLEAVLVRNVTLPAQIQQKITDKLAAEQEALQMKFVIEKQQAENQQQLMAAQAAAERQKLEAETEAQIQHTKAQAAAEAKRIDGEATAAYQHDLAASLTPAMLRLREIEAERAFAGSTNTKLVFMGNGGAHALLDLRDGARAPGNPYP